MSQLLYDAALRGCLLDELYELLSFLQSRLQDMASTQNSAFLVSLTDVVEEASSAGIQSWLQVRHLMLNYLLSTVWDAYLKGTNSRRE